METRYKVDATGVLKDDDVPWASVYRGAFAISLESELGPFSGVVVTPKSGFAPPVLDMLFYDSAKVLVIKNAREDTLAEGPNNLPMHEILWQAFCLVPKAHGYHPGQLVLNNILFVQLAYGTSAMKRVNQQTNPPSPMTWHNRTNAGFMEEWAPIAGSDLVAPVVEMLLAHNYQFQSRKAVTTIVCFPNIGYPRLPGIHLGILLGDDRRTTPPAAGAGPS